MKSRTKIAIVVGLVGAAALTAITVSGACPGITGVLADLASMPIKGGHP